MTIDLMKVGGQQINLTIAEFAKLLSKGWVFNSCIRYYTGSLDLNYQLAADSDLKYHNAVYRPSVDDLVSFLNSLEEVNETFEYCLSYSDQIPIDKFVNMTYTKQADTILLEVY